MWNLKIDFVMMILLASYLLMEHAPYLEQTLKNVGGYSEDVNTQDGWDLWYKLAERMSAINIQTPVFYYRQHGKSMSRDNDRLLQARSKIFEQISSKLKEITNPQLLAVIPVKESFPDFEGGTIPTNKWSIYS